MYKSLAKNYGIALIFILFAFVLWRGFMREGYILSKYGHVATYNGEAKLIIFLVSLWAFILLSFAIYQTICGYIFIKRKDFESNKIEPEYLICPNCQEVFSFKEIHSSTCKICNVELESLDGFYKKHPELK